MWIKLTSSVTRRNLSVALLAFILIVLPIVALRISQTYAYDMQSLVLVLWRLNGLLIWVIGAQRLISMIQQDDLEQDYDRINNGNTAVAIYRGFEFFGFVIAAALLISKV